MLNIIRLSLVLFALPAAAQGPGPLWDPGVAFSTADLLGQISDVPVCPLPVVVSSFTVPEITEDEVSELEEGDGSGEEIFAGPDELEPPMPADLGGNGRLTILRYKTKEKVTLRYRTDDGGYDMDEIARFAHVARCTLTGREMDMSIKLVELLDAVEDHFGKKGIVLLSGYRTLKLNRTLPGAAEHSRHMLGWAADIRIPGYSSAAVKKFALKLGAGGVGYYPVQGFTHLDVGRVRYWEVRRKARHHTRKRRAKPLGRIRALLGNRLAEGLEGKGENRR